MDWLFEGAMIKRSVFESKEGRQRKRVFKVNFHYFIIGLEPPIMAIIENYF